jgi:hypothetical protein
LGLWCADAIRTAVRLSGLVIVLGARAVYGLGLPTARVGHGRHAFARDRSPTMPTFFRHGVSIPTPMTPSRCYSGSWAAAVTVVVATHRLPDDLRCSALC